jgi:hypothetical protein
MDAVVAAVTDERRGLVSDCLELVDEVFDILSFDEAEETVENKSLSLFQTKKK